MSTAQASLWNMYWELEDGRHLYDINGGQVICPPGGVGGTPSNATAVGVQEMPSTVGESSTAGGGAAATSAAEAAESAESQRQLQQLQTENESLMAERDGLNDEVSRLKMEASELGVELARLRLAALPLVDE